LQHQSAPRSKFEAADEKTLGEIKPLLHEKRHVSAKYRPSSGSYDKAQFGIMCHVAHATAAPNAMYLLHIGYTHAFQLQVLFGVLGFAARASGITAAHRCWDPVGRLQLQ
jgi:hypothetical protein